MKDFQKLRELLESQETFPLNFTVKFIGRNTSRFQSGVLRFESEHTALTAISRRESAKATHVALTYSYLASSADAVIAILERVARIEDVEVVL